MPAPEKPKVEPKLTKEEVYKAKEPEAINLEKTKKKESDAIKKLKAQMAIEQIKKDLDHSSKKELEAKNLAAMTQKKFKGNILAAGNALTGLDKLQHETYISSMDKAIKQNWYLPEWLRKKGLKTVVTVKIDEKGRIISRAVTKASGNHEYDESGIEAIEKAAPFDPPPEKFIERLQIKGFDVEFAENV